MKPIEPALASASAGRSALISLALPIFTVSLFTSALLLFAVQPMFTKMVLPVLGGSPSVWSVAMVFFQGALLAGYLYAHALTRFLDVRRAAVVHLLMMVVAFLALPIGLAQGAGEPPAEGTAFWLIGLFALSVGLPFFVVAGNGPLLQAWFARSGHPHANDPYFLYGASNLGSFAALLSYPVVIEPLVPLQGQSLAWTAGFVVLAAMIALSAMSVSKAMAEESWRGVPVSLERSAAPAWSLRLTWIGLAFVPSALLVAVTAHLSTDVAAAPFLWVLPLSLFLLTFVLVFRAKPILAHGLMLMLQPILVGAVALTIANVVGGLMLLTVVIALAAFFVSTMVAHAELYALRPKADRLTEFYLFMSLGGVLGGAFASLAAPLLFSSVYEYPILVVAALLCRPAYRAMKLGAWAPEAVIVALVGLALALPGFTGRHELSADDVVLRAFVLIALAAIVMLSANRPGRLVGMTVALLLLGFAYVPGFGKAEHIRSFFGVHKIVETADGRFRVLMHGTTIHGAERIRNEDGTPYEGAPMPATYYYPGGPMAEAIQSVRFARGGQLTAVAGVGLGTGSLACHAMADETWRFYEIDPDVVEIARDPGRFRFMSVCRPDADVVLGDARLTLARAKTRYDLLVLDAFTSDAIPVHLLTVEALDTWLGNLNEQGVVIAHISNRHMDLRPVVANVAAARGLKVWFKSDPSKERFEDNYNAPAMIAVIGKNEQAVGLIATEQSWTELTPDPAIATWTDDYSNVLQAIWLRLRQP